MPPNSEHYGYYGCDVVQKEANEFVVVPASVFRHQIHNVYVVTPGSDTAPAILCSKSEPVRIFQKPADRYASLHYLHVQGGGWNLKEFIGGIESLIKNLIGETKPQKNTNQVTLDTIQIKLSGMGYDVA